MDSLRRYVARKTGRGTTNIRLTPKGVELLKNQTRLSREKIRQVYQTRGALRYIPKQVRSYRIVRSRKDRIHPYDRVRPTHVKDLLDRKVLTQKQVWIRHVRQARAYLRTLRGSAPHPAYRQVYRRIKGGLYRGKTHWKQQIVRGLKIHEA